MINFNSISLNTIVIVLTVILILVLVILLIFALSLFRLVNNKQKDLGRYESNSLLKPTTSSNQNIKMSFEDIADEDMKVAALIATIDYSNETKKDVRLLSIRQIA